MDSPQEPSQDRTKRSQSNTYLKYAGLGMQLFVTIGVAGWLGYKIDQYLKIRFPAFLLSFVLIALVGSLYLLMRSLKNE